MKKSLKAALLAAFICPGAGHFYLKKHLVGGVILAFALASLSAVIIPAFERAQIIAEQVASGKIAPDLTTIYSLITQAPVGDDAITMNLASAAFMLAWTVGVLDAYRLGRQQDNQEKANYLEP